MSRRRLRRIPALPALCAAAIALTALTGCQGRKVVARVNSATITEEDFLNRVQYVRQIPQNVSLDAGGLTLVNMIEDTLTDQLATDKKWTPTEEAVKQVAEIVRRTTPDIEQQLTSKQLTEEELYRQVRHLLELTAIGTEGAKADPTEVQKAYDEMKKDPIYPATYTIRVLFVTDPVRANDEKILAQLKSSANFKEAAKALNMTAPEIANAGRELVMPKKGAPEDLIKALDALGNGPFTPEKGPFTNGPITINQNPNAGGKPIYLIAQLIGKQADETPPLDKVRPFIEQRVLQQKFPQWQMHAQQKVGEYTKTAQIQINEDRYKPILDSVIMPQANAHTEQPGGMAPGGAPPAGAPGAGGPPTMPDGSPVGGGAPPSAPPGGQAPSAPGAGGAPGAPK